MSAKVATVLARNLHRQIAFCSGRESCADCLRIEEAIEQAEARGRKEMRNLLGYAWEFTDHKPTCGDNADPDSVEPLLCDCGYAEFEDKFKRTMGRDAKPEPEIALKRGGRE